jgi:antitoxin MazE
VLTERNDHLDRLESGLAEKVRHVVVLRAGLSRTQRQAELDRLAAIPPSERTTSCATPDRSGNPPFTTPVGRPSASRRPYVTVAQPEPRGDPARVPHDILWYRYIYMEGTPMQVARWGNSLAVRLPAAVVEALELEAGDEIEILVAGDRAFAVSRDRRKGRAIERLRRLRRALPAGFTFDREAVNER